MAFDYNAFRAEKFARQNPALASAIARPLENRISEMDAALAQKDAEIARLRRESDDRLGALVAEQEQNEALKREVAMFKDEVAAIKKQQAAPAPSGTRKGRKQ